MIKSASILTVQPSSSNYSHNGLKFTRLGGYVNHQIELVYKPLTPDEFRGLHSTAQAAQGQYNPFQLKVDQILNYDNSTRPKWSSGGFLTANYSAGTKKVTLTYPNASDGDLVAKPGQYIFLSGGGASRSLFTVVNNAYSTSNQATLRLAEPVQQDITTAVNRFYLLTPGAETAVVTLANNGFEYAVDTVGFYFVKVTFDVDKWK